jgi:hypothetical protein
MRPGAAHIAGWGALSERRRTCTVCEMGAIQASGRGCRKVLCYRQADLAALAAAQLHHRRARRGVPLRDVQIAARHADPRTHYPL